MQPWLPILYFQVFEGAHMDKIARVGPLKIPGPYYYL